MKPISAVRLAACFVAVLCTAMLFWATICLVIAIEEDQKY